MTNKDIDFFEVSNPKCELPKDVLAAMGARRDSHLADLREKAANLYHLQEELKIREKLRSDHPLHFPPLDPTPVAGEAQLWWAKSYYFKNTNEVNVFFTDDGINIVGTLISRSGNLMNWNVTIVAQFGLGRDRMPSPFTHRLFISNPVAELYGSVFGLTDGGFWGFGDQWAKCWLTTTQRVFILSDTGVENSENRTIVFNEEHIGLKWGDLPGYFGMPPVDVFLDPTTNSVQVDLIFSFDFQLEGDAEVSFNLSPGGSAVLRTYQWELVPK